MAFVAGRTRTLRLVTSVMILPYRNPVLTAKMLATIDVLSRGRVTVGVGVGWLREEFEALDSPDFDRRGAASDEYLRIFKTLWTQNPASFAGEFYRFDGAPLPAPARAEAASARSGSAATARRRCAGWRATATAGIPSAPTPPCRCARPSCAPRSIELHRMTEAEGRDPVGADDLVQGAGLRRRRPRRSAAPSAGRSRARPSRSPTTSAPTRSSA